MTMALTAAQKERQEMRETYIDVEEYYGDERIRWAQLAGRNALVQGIEDGIRTQLLKMPTGSGKTLTIACTLDCPEIRSALKIVDRPLKVVLIAHLQRLLTQAERAFAETNHVDLTVFTPFGDIPQQDLDDADIIVMDEAHHEAMMSVQMQLEKMVAKPIIGLTATDERADGMVIKFERIIEPVTREEAVREGWLAETSIWSFVDTSGRNKTEILKKLFDQYHHIMGKTLVFCRTHKEVREITHHLNDLGHSAVGLLHQNAQEIDTILDDFSAGKYDFIVNCGRLGEGIDVKGCVSVVLGRTVGSYPLLNQIIGRSARPDSESQVFELINPLSGRNLDTTVVTGTPKAHYLCAPSVDGKFREYEFEYVNTSAHGMEEHESNWL